MITKTEFLAALEIVNNYKTQVSSEFKEMKKELIKNNSSHLVITRDTLLKDADISIRAMNVLRAFAVSEIDEFKHDWELPSWEQLKVGHFENCKRTLLINYRNFGKKSVTEIEQMLFDAGIILTD